MRSHAYTIAMVAVLATSVFAGGIGALATPVSADDHEAGVTFSDGTSGGATVVVDEVTVPSGGFVTIHDDTLTDGNTLGSVVGTSAYLEPGTHEAVTVELDDQIDDGTFHAMAHQDTDDDRAYTFVSSSGTQDAPYTADGDIVMANAAVTVSATVSASDQPTDGESFVVDRVELSEGGFVTVHDSTLLDGDVIESVRGTSEYLAAGVHENVRVQFDEALEAGDTLVPMAHRDTNDNQAYDFVTSEGENDGPFLSDSNEAVLDTAAVELRDDAMVSFDAQASGGTTLAVDEVFVPEGGFVTMHDSSLADGATFESIRGTSAYLSPGLHQDVAVTLDDPLDADDAPFAMAHRDTNGNEGYDFRTSDGGADGPYTADGDIVMESAPVTVAASASLDRQTSDGTTVVVDQVDLAEGGFVTIHDSTLKSGDVFESVRGTSEYLEAGSHEDVVVELDEPIAETRQLLAMPHRDTNGNQGYDFVASEGENDGPYTAGGDIVMDEGTVSVSASVVADAAASDGETVVVERATLHNGGFVTVHDSSLLDGDVIESIRGTSMYLEPGTHEDIEIVLHEPLESDDTLFAMAHLDTNGNQGYDFVTSAGSADGPYVAAGAPVMGTLDLTVDGAMDDDEMDSDDGMTDDEMDGDDGMTDDEAMDDEMNESEDGTNADDSGPGFGAIVALIALAVVAGIAAIAWRRQ